MKNVFSILFLFILLSSCRNPVSKFTPKIYYLQAEHRIIVLDSDLIITSVEIDTSKHDNATYDKQGYLYFDSLSLNEVKLDDLIRKNFSNKIDLNKIRPLTISLLVDLRGESPARGFSFYLDIESGEKKDSCAFQFDREE